MSGDRNKIERQARQLLRLHSSEHNNKGLVTDECVQAARKLNVDPKEAPNREVELLKVFDDDKLLRKFIKDFIEAASKLSGPDQAPSEDDSSTGGNNFFARLNPFGGSPSRSKGQSEGNDATTDTFVDATTTTPPNEHKTDGTKENPFVVSSTEPSASPEPSGAEKTTTKTTTANSSESPSGEQEKKTGEKKDIFVDATTTTPPNEHTTDGTKENPFVVSSTKPSASPEPSGAEKTTTKTTTANSSESPSGEQEKKAGEKKDSSSTENPKSTKQSDLKGANTGGSGADSGAGKTKESTTDKSNNKEGSGSSDETETSEGASTKKQEEKGDAESPRGSSGESAGKPGHKKGPDGNGGSNGNGGTSGSSTGHSGSQQDSGDSGDSNGQKGGGSTGKSGEKGSSANTGDSTGTGSGGNDGGARAGEKLHDEFFGFGSGRGGGSGRRAGGPAKNHDSGGSTGGVPGNTGTKANTTGPVGGDTAGSGDADGRNVGGNNIGSSQVKIEEADEQIDDVLDFNPMDWEKSHARSDNHMERPELFYRGIALDEDPIPSPTANPHVWHEIRDPEHDNGLVWALLRGKTRKNSLVFEFPGRDGSRLILVSPIFNRGVAEAYRKKTGEDITEVPYGDPTMLVGKKLKDNYPQELAFAVSKGERNNGDGFLVWHNPAEQWFPVSTIKLQMGRAQTERFLNGCRPGYNLPDPPELTHQQPRYNSAQEARYNSAPPAPPPAHNSPLPNRRYFSEPLRLSRSSPQVPSASVSGYPPGVLPGNPPPGATLYQVPMTSQSPGQQGFGIQNSQQGSGFPPQWMPYPHQPPQPQPPYGFSWYPVPGPVSGAPPQGQPAPFPYAASAPPMQAPVQGSMPFTYQPVPPTGYPAPQPGQPQPGAHKGKHVQMAHGRPTPFGSMTPGP